MLWAVALPGNPITGNAGCCAFAASGHAADEGDELAPSHVFNP